MPAQLINAGKYNHELAGSNLGSINVLQLLEKRTEINKTLWPQKRLACQHTKNCIGQVLLVSAIAKVIFVILTCLNILISPQSCRGNNLSYFSMLRKKYYFYIQKFYIQIFWKTSKSEIIGIPTKLRSATECITVPRFAKLTSKLCI